MKVLFINPSSILYTKPYSQINLGCAYVMTSVEKDHRVFLLDRELQEKQWAGQVVAALNRFKPDAVGFSVTSFSLSYALKIAALIKQTCPDIPLVYGGVHPTLLPEETLRNHLVDAVCIGEGEDAFKEYLGRLQNHQEPLGVAGIWFKNKAGVIVKNPLRPFREDLDSLPFPNWDYWDQENRLRISNLFQINVMQFITSRGCPYSCTFCSNSALRVSIPGKFYRLRSPQNIIEEVAGNVNKYYSRGLRHLTFSDETFGFEMQHLQELCALYVKENLAGKITWDCLTRVEVVTEEWARTVKKAGCVLVGLGIESGDEFIRQNVYNKKFTNQQIVNAVSILRKNKLMFRTNFIVGGPEDTKKTIQASLGLSRMLKPQIASYFLYQPLPKTTLGDKILSAQTPGSPQEYIAESSFSHRLGLTTPLLVTKYLTAADLKKIMLKISVRRVFSWFLNGIKLRGGMFIFDIFKQVIYFITKIGPMSPMCAYIQLELNTTLYYTYNKFYKD
jgi:anaerobic magnesium-protoporphyrin IX monomethyl ester cyclase